MKVARYKPWMCWRCGYTMDSASHTSRKSNAPPAEHDVSICLNCGETYELVAGKWITLPSSKFAALPATLQGQVQRAQSVRARIVTVNLARRDGRA